MGKTCLVAFAKLASETDLGEREPAARSAIGAEAKMRGEEVKVRCGVGVDEAGASVRLARARLAPETKGMTRCDVRDSITVVYLSLNRPGEGKESRIQHSSLASLSRSRNLQTHFGRAKAVKLLWFSMRFNSISTLFGLKLGFESD